MRRRASLALLALLLPAAAGAQTVGEIVLVRNDVRGTAPGAAERPLAVEDAVLLQMEVATGVDSFTQMTFDPEGSLELGPETRIVVDESVARPDAHRSVLSLLLGKLLVAVTPTARREVTVETPTAVIGIRGTVVGIAVDATGATRVSVLEGEVEVRSRDAARRRTVRLRPGFRTAVAPGRAPTPPAPRDPQDWTLTAAAGGEPFNLPQEDLLDDSPVPTRRGDQGGGRPGGPGPG